jgi:hypothetical protein
VARLVGQGGLGAGWPGASVREGKGWEVGLGGHGPVCRAGAG